MDVSTNKHNCYISINVKDLKQTCPFWNNHLSRSLWISRVHVFSASPPLQASRLARLSPTLVGGRHAHPSRTGAPSPGRADPGAASAERRNVVGKGVDESMKKRSSLTTSQHLLRKLGRHPGTLERLRKRKHCSCKLAAREAYHLPVLCVRVLLGSCI